jgi:hypothetical protein
MCGGRLTGRTWREVTTSTVTTTTGRRPTGGGTGSIPRAPTTSASFDRWWSIIPNQSIIAKGVGSGIELNAAGHSSAADWALVYLSGGCTASIRMDRVKTSESVAASWIDPRSGDRQPIGTSQYADVRDFSTPEGWEDALLLLEGE